jgi:hypothetical protein
MGAIIATLYRDPLARFSLGRAGGTRLSRLPDARRSRWRTNRQAKWKLQARRQDEGSDSVDARDYRADQHDRRRWPD